MTTIDDTHAPADVEVYIPTSHALSTRSGRRRVPLRVICALFWLGLLVLVAVFADLLPLEDPTVEAGGINDPAWESWSEPFGTDGFARSQLSRVIYGARVSLPVGIAAGAAGMVVGGLLGVWAGFRRGKVDGSVSIFADAMMSFPPLIMLLALVTVLEPSLKTVIVGLAVVSIPGFLRLARANTIRVSQLEYVLSARSLGARTSRIVFREIIPNVVIPVLAFATVITATLMVAEASLSYLGVGIPPPNPSWGGMVAAGQRQLQYHPEQVYIPGGVLFLTVASINLIAIWLREALDVTQSKL